MKSRALRVKKGITKHDIGLVFGIAVVLGSTITLLITLIVSIFYDYKVLLSTNHFYECYIEIAALTSGIIIFVYELKRVIKPPTN